MKNLLLILLTLTSAALIKCKKKDTPKSVNTLEQTKSVEKTIGKNGVSFSINFEKGEIASKMKMPENKDSKFSCMPNYTLNISNYIFGFTGNSCGGGWSGYTSKIYFSITDNGTIPITNPSTLSLDMWALGTSGSQPHVNVTYLGSSGNVYYYVTDVIDWSSLNVNYCNATGIYFDSWVPFFCNGQNMSMEVEAEMDFSSFNSCQALSPAYVDATQPGGIYYFGWALACSPCNFIGTESFDFQYRLQGTSSWNTLTKTYYGGPYFLPLSIGIYEWRHRNKKISSVSCDGPWSEVQTFTVN